MIDAEKPDLLPYDDDYVLVSKRRLIAGNNCIAAMANFISGLTNNSMNFLIATFAKESIRIVECLPQSEIDKRIEIITSTYNQKPEKSA